MSVRLEAEAEAALEAVASAEEMLAGANDRIVLGEKGSRRDVVTRLDLLLERHITASLAKTGLPVLGEEAFAAHPVVPEPDRPFWLVDPIDGTVNYATGLPFYAISVGLWREGAFRVGAVSLPAFKELFFTHGEEGAFLNGRALEARPATLDTALVGASIPSRPGQDGMDHYGLFGRVDALTRGCLRLGSAASLICLVACNRLQGAYGFRAKLWDVAGGLAVAARAGCEVWTRLHPGRPVLDYVVAAPGVGQPLRELVQAGIDPAEARS